ncbi:MAG: nitrophenyl compound nitroreductase subunit ArsF family protein [Bacteroidales bacterium]
MKKLTLIVLSIFFSLSLFAQETKKDFVQVYYFHRTERCATCNAIEDGVTSVLNSSYKKDLQKGNIIFSSINYEEDTNSAIIKSYEIENPTLLIIYNKKDKKEFIDLTDDAFSYARTNPSKFKKIFKSKINDFFR